MPTVVVYAAGHASMHGGDDVAMQGVRRLAMSTKEAEYLSRLENGEENPWLVYGLCKAWRPDTLDELLYRMPSGVSLECVVEGYEEFVDARRDR